MKSRYQSSSSEVHINKRTKITDPVASELDFDIKQVKSDEDLATLTEVNDMVEHNTKNSKVNAVKTNGKLNAEHQRESALRLELSIPSSLAYIQACGIFLHSATLWVFLLKPFTPEVKGSLNNRNYVNVLFRPSQMQHPTVTYIMWTQTSNTTSWLDTKPFCPTDTSATILCSGCRSSLTISSSPPCWCKWM